jgi:flagellar basal body-associated protein FliL
MVKIKSKKILIVVLSTILSIVMVVVLLLFFPLMGKKHTEVWSAKQEFKLDQLQTVEKTSNQDFKYSTLDESQR